jgi:predicted ATPase
LLKAAPHLQVIATSRQRLDLQGELQYRLGGLAFQPGDHPDSNSQADAARLFLQSARQLQPGISLGPETQADITRICQLVAGMPLAIILAAAWVDVLAPQAIADELSQSLDLLETEKNDIPGRQRSIRVVIANSLELLPTPDRHIFVKLGVFQGGFTRQAAAAVAGASLKQLSNFSGRSLVHFDPHTQRYQLHPLVHQYARETLAEAGHLEDVQAAHMEYFTEWLAGQEKDLQGGAQIQALDHIQRDFHNIAAAWAHAVQQEHFTPIGRVLEPVYWYCIMRDRIPDGERLFRAARECWIPLSNPAHSAPQLRLILRFDASGSAYQSQLEEALAQARPENSTRSLAFLLWAHGVNGYTMRDLRRAIQRLEESLSIFQDLGDHFYTIEVLHLLWMCYWFLGNREKSLPYYDQALDLSQKTGNKVALARALGAQGAFQLASGEFDQADQSMQASYALRQEIQDRSGMSISLAHLGWLAALRGDLKAGNRLAEMGLKLAQEIHNTNTRTTALNILGWIAALEENFELAEKYCQESRERAPDPTVQLGASLGLAFATCGLGTYDACRSYLAHLLEFAIASRADGILLMCLPVAAVLLAENGDEETAVELVEQVHSFPVENTLWLRNWAPYAVRQAAWEHSLGSEKYAAAVLRGKNRTLAETAEKIFSFLRGRA